MSIAAVSSYSSQPSAQTGSSLHALAIAVQSGNIAAAQQAFNSLSPHATQGIGSAPLQQLGQALQSGDLRQAQSALSLIQATQARAAEIGASSAATSRAIESALGGNVDTSA
ncbi:hypothetical protein [Paludibacterium yongneupense]|uniref:hypothetical protein n=1 Tax=Paludibacterium yongneupense TaxID=400061 RepID=UPI00041A95D4|nr:hypothetical protein [Paludibacterium yongneupense]